MKCSDCINLNVSDKAIICLSDTYDPGTWTVGKYKAEGAEKCIGFAPKDSEAK